MSNGSISNIHTPVSSRLYSTSFAAIIESIFVRNRDDMNFTLGAKIMQPEFSTDNEHESKVRPGV